MNELIINPSAGRDERPDPAQEVERLEALLAERRAELTGLREEMRDFRALYARTVGGRLAELSEVERAVREAEARLLGLEPDGDAEADEAEDLGGDAAAESRPARLSLRKLFWSVARAFHPDHASDEHEARRRHAVMAEASRAYREGDDESLRSLLGDEELRLYCASPRREEAARDAAGRLVALREELRTIEFGVKRLRQDRLYALKRRVDEEARHGRDLLAAEAERVNRQIVKARRRLEHLS